MVFEYSYQTRDPFYHDEEICHLWRSLDRYMYDPEWRKYVFAFRFMLCTGTRRHETTRIRVVDCTEKWVRIKWGKGTGNKFDLGRTKERDAAWPTFFQPYYEEYFASLPKSVRVLFPAKRTKDYTEQRHRCVHKDTIYLRWRSFCEMVKLRYLKPHDAFRKTFATWFQDYLPRHDLQDQLGHNDYKTTDKIYRHSLPGRRFEKPKPDWFTVAEEGAAKVAETLSRKHLRVLK